MTADQVWPDETVDVIAGTIARTVFAHAVGSDELWDPADAYHCELTQQAIPAARAVLAALSVHAVPRPDEWEWNVRDRDGVLMLIEGVSEEEARGWFTPRFRRTVVRRRPAGPWEVAP